MVPQEASDGNWIKETFQPSPLQSRMHKPEKSNLLQIKHSHMNSIEV